MKAKAKKQIREIASLEALPDEMIDTSDIRELRDWSGAMVGKFYRPISAQKKSPKRLKESVFEH